MRDLERTGPMAAYDFNIQVDRSKFEVSGFSECAAIARQIIYDVSRSRPAEGDTLTRNRSYAEPYQRHELGIKLGLVYLISRLDRFLGSQFASLWGQRRDMLMEWLKDKLPRRRTGESKETPYLSVQLDDLWQHDYRQKSLETYFQQRVYMFWEGGSPKEKLDALRKRVLHFDIPANVLGTLEEALLVRNEFVHPACAPRPVGEEKVKHPRISIEWFEQVVGATLVIVEACVAAHKRATSRYIASNLERVCDGLTPAQRITFSSYYRMAGPWYKTLDELLAFIDKASSEGEAIPEMLVLWTSSEVMTKLDLLKKFSKRHNIPIALWEQWRHPEPGLTKDQHRQLEALQRGNDKFTFIPERSYPKGQYDPTHKPVEVLQKLVELKCRQPMHEQGKHIHHPQ